MTTQSVPAREAAVVLEVRDLKTVFRTSEGLARAVDGVSFRIRHGESFALVGESGCGKTVTALSILQLLDRPAGAIESGSILYQGQDLLRLSEIEKRRVRGNLISMIFQEPMTSLNPVLSVGTQITEVLRRHQGLSRKKARRACLEMLEMVHLPEPARRLREYPHQLSGGMKQRVMIAIALACRPGLLIADEPTTALDVTIQEQILGLIRELRAALGTAVLLITHNLGVVAENADRVGVMYAGRIVEEGDLASVLHHPCHPYTVKLLASLPSAPRRGEALQTIEGRVPPAHRFPPGCRFAERCHKAMPVCRDIDPPLFPVGTGHRAACLLHDATLMGRRVDVRELRNPAPPAPRPADRRDDSVLLGVHGLKLWFPVKRGLLQRTAAQVRAVDGVDLAVRKGTTMGLVGESGSGKTTLGRAVLQLIRPTAGKVIFDGRDLTRLGRTALKPYRRRLQVVFQDPFGSLDPRMTVGETILEGMAAHRLGAGRAERLRRTRELMEKVGLDPHMAGRYPHEFSGGQRQRIAIARALAVQPEFIVCDEAASALDVSVQAQILNLLKALQAELGLTYLFISHDLTVVEYLADELAVMYLGRIVEHGAAAEVFLRPAHPYTRALLSAVPQLDPATRTSKIRLSGEVPSPVNPPPGCPFHPRCPDAMRRCSTEVPPAFSLGPSHRACCWLCRTSPSPDPGEPGVAEGEDQGHSKEG